MPKTTMMAWKLRSALGETTIALHKIKQFPSFLPKDVAVSLTTELIEVISRLQKVSEILQCEANLVEERKTPTLKFGKDILEHTINFDCIKDFLQTKDDDTA